MVGDISGEHIKDEAVSTSQGQVVKSPCLYASHQDGPEIRLHVKTLKIKKNVFGIVIRNYCWRL